MEQHRRMWKGFRRKKSIVIVIILILIIFLIIFISELESDLLGSDPTQQLTSEKDFIDFPVYSEEDIVPKSAIKDTVKQRQGKRNGELRIYFEFPEAGTGNKSECVPLKTRKGSTPICIFSPNEDRMISSYVRDYGTWEPDIVNATTDVLLSDPDMHFVDLGCNIGVFTLSIASLGKSVIAVDPLKESLQLLSKSLSLGGLRENVTLLLNAISDVPGPVNVHIVPDNMGGSYIRTDEKKRENVVESILLDDLLSVMNFRKVFIKMDIEGSEFKAIMGASLFFHSVDVRYILMEWMMQRQTRNGEILAEHLMKHGFLPYKDARKLELLHPDNFGDWPDNMFWIKR